MKLKKRTFKKVAAMVSTFGMDVPSILTRGYTWLLLFD